MSAHGRRGRLARGRRRERRSLSRRRPGRSEHRPGFPGRVKIWPGTPTGPSTQAITVTQASSGIPGSSENGDRFGDSVAVGRLDGDRYADLVVGAPGEDRSAGRVTVIRGGSSGFARAGHRTLGQDTAGVPGVRESGDEFGAAVTLLDGSGDRTPDLAVGAPGEDATRGAMTTLRGGGSGLFTTSGARTFGLTGAVPRSPDWRGSSFGSVLGRLASSSR